MTKKQESRKEICVFLDGELSHGEVFVNVLKFKCLRRFGVHEYEIESILKIYVESGICEREKTQYGDIIKIKTQKNGE